ncbi:MAG: histidine phosphatase family protein [Lachnospiraceae bacterium]|nr:histidine phosphatase family protein [Lachnospiraceae bacterium]
MRISKIDPQVSAYYVSPLGRAQQTCNACLSPLGKEATVLPWIEEYTGRTFYGTDSSVHPLD